VKRGGKKQLKSEKVWIVSERGNIRVVTTAFKRAQSKTGKGEEPWGATTPQEAGWGKFREGLETDYECAIDWDVIACRRVLKSKDRWVHKNDFSR